VRFVDVDSVAIVALPPDTGQRRTGGDARQRHVRTLAHDHVSTAQRVINVGGNWKNHGKCLFRKILIIHFEI